MITVMSTTSTVSTKTTVRLKLEKFNSCKTWLEGYNSPATKNTYKIHLSLFCRHHNINPDSLFHIKPEQIKTMVLDYVIHLKKIAVPLVGKAKRSQISVNSVKDYLSGIQSFFVFHEIMINWKKIVKYCPEEVPNNLRAYTKEEITKLLSVADLRDRCLILLMT